MASISALSKGARRFRLAVLLVVASSICMAQEIPKLPATVQAPAAIGLECFKNAKTLPVLEGCRLAVETVRQTNEEYNARIQRFCRSLLGFDASLRAKAASGKLAWEDYEEIKVGVANELTECDAQQGDYFAPYRARVREYRAAMEYHGTQREAIVRGIRGL